ncbi:helix-turn-helix domain-containing protein [Acidithiobacillus ferrooxidans]|uniref:helix-turn-helix domain-containing protein n=1 Tax=Acidithiobacillus ferrooxidans TaxID=920 RepID=UPI001D012CF2
MALHPDRMFSSPELSIILAERNQTMQSNAIAVQIYQLRKTLGVVGADTWLETVRGFGYRLVVPQSDKTPPSSTAHGGLHETP